ncbi:MAG: hypothetical protein KDA92_23395, partial [Planctomycetales bacterium]|nr:hypothetical protein [Planctomycetales bacterium]
MFCKLQLRAFVRLLIMLLISVVRLQSATAQEVRFDYDPANGNFSMNADVELTTLEIKSELAVFTGPEPSFIARPFDVYTPTKLFTLKTQGVSILDFGPVFDAGLSAQFLADNLCMQGSIKPSGELPS